MATNDMKIKVINKDHGKTGNGAKALDSLLRNKTVAAFRASLEKKGLKGYASWTLRFAKENGLVKLEA